ncbi:hypothetical protein F4680DRAFT_449383 [Xylaria scruposa]|nr:hypothetical protein F4680DRAFT_449383 [Xylaria scruposa]
MCQVYREQHSQCGHPGKVRVSHRCAIGKGTCCPKKRRGPVEIVPGRCASCRREDQQAERDFLKNADPGTLMAHKFRTWKRRILSTSD